MSVGGRAVVYMGGASEQQQAEVQRFDAGDRLLPVVEGGELGQLLTFIQLRKTFPHFGFRLGQAQILELGEVHGGDGLPPEQERVELAACQVQHFYLQLQYTPRVKSNKTHQVPPLNHFILLKSQIHYQIIFLYMKLKLIKFSLF